MAKKLTTSEERLLIEAAPLSELAFGAEECPARHLRRALDHPLFDTPIAAMPLSELILAEGNVREDPF
jgi:hypothetical protein